MNQRTIASLLGLILTATGLGCTSTKAVETSDSDAVAEEACFNVRDVRSFDAIHDRFVYVRCVRGKHYLLTMENACVGLQNSLAVTVESGFNRVCSNDWASLTYRNFDRTTRCGILRVEAVEDRAAAVALVESR
jgi:hypothetical protein